MIINSKQAIQYIMCHCLPHVTPVCCILHHLESKHTQELEILNITVTHTHTYICIFNPSVFPFPMGTLDYFLSQCRKCITRSTRAVASHLRIEKFPCARSAKSLSSCIFICTNKYSKYQNLVAAASSISSNSTNSFQICPLQIFSLRASFVPCHTKTILSPLLYPLSPMSYQN